MTDTEAKALALVNEHRSMCPNPLTRIQTVFTAQGTYGSAWDALCCAIEREAATEARHAAELREQAERFDAFRQEVSDAIESCMLGPIAEERLNPFILPAPDPLVEVIAVALREASPFADDGRDYTAEAKVAAAAVRAQQKDTNA